MRLRAGLLALVAAGATAPASASAASTIPQPTLRAGAGKADITPRTGYYLGGWTRADRIAQGQHTRLYSRALVLERGGRKVALVAIDLFMVPGGMVEHIGQRLAARGLSAQNILISASHTHSGPGGYANYPTLNTAAPSLQTATDPLSFARFLSPEPADPQLYRFLTEQIATAIARADDDLGPASAGWGGEEIHGLTRNRSLEAHLNDHGIVKARGEGKESDDPEGAEHPIDPGVDVLRIDKRIRRKGRTVSVPIGAWSNFADHGTVTKSSFQFYNGDHHASAERVFEAGVRERGKVPAGQEIVNVYGNANEGDMSAGLDRDGPAASDFVGRVEASAMLRAWKAAGKAMSRTPILDSRWTRVCFCGQEVSNGYRVADKSQVGLPFLTGSEEERGPLFDVTGQTYEDTRGPDQGSPHGVKASAPAGDVPRVVPLVAVRVGSRVIASIPGEGTKEVGARMRAAVTSAIAGSGVERVALSGLANEFVLYFTTPEEYDRQHYEGGNTHFGRLSSVLITQEMAKLAGILVRGEPAPAPAPFDSTNGVRPDGPAYGGGATTGSIVGEPQGGVVRLERATFAWQGGPQGLDRPVDRAFVIVERRDGERWTRVTDDLGLQMLWKVNPAGRHDAQWEVPLNAKPGEHRFVVEAKGYRLVSRPFSVSPTKALRVVEQASTATRIAVTISYPAAIRDVDLTSRPAHPTGGAVRFVVAGRPVLVRRPDDGTFAVRVPAGSSVSIPAGGATDGFGNANATALRLR